MKKTSKKSVPVNESSTPIAPVHLTPEPPRHDKYLYLWAVALVSFGIGVLTGYGIGFKRYAPELVEQYMVLNSSKETLATLKAKNATAPKAPVAQEKTETPPAPPAESLAPNTQELLEKADAWLASKGFNLYGDPLDSVYAGGTPLFNESTGELTDRYEYLKKKFPEEPWLK